MLIILPLYAEKDSACSSLDEEEGGNAGRTTTGGGEGLWSCWGCLAGGSGGFG